jgi:phosphocarrier protein HPr
MIAMTGESLRRTFTVTNPQGLHMRPITAFAEKAMTYKSDVSLGKSGGSSVNGKSPIALMGIMAEQGTELVLEVCGPDAAAAMEALLEVLASPALDE